jgi:hypothetical protein
LNSKVSNLLTASRDAAATLPGPSMGAVKVLALVLVAVGVIARLSPLFDPTGRLFWQFMTEDGYLMQIIARNMAIGLGMSVSEGTIATNGVQPLATFLFAACHWLAGGSKTLGIAFVTIAATLFSVGAGYWFYRTATIVLARLPQGREIALFAAALWFSAPLIIPTTMNGLETGLYFMVALMTMHYYLKVVSTGAGTFSNGQRLTFGVLLGLAFLARNDAVFFIACLLLVHLFVGGAAYGGYARRLVDCIVGGATSMIIASPWLIYNYRLFGSIVPISGTAQSHGTAIGANLPLVPAKLLEASSLFLPLPRSLEEYALIAAFALLFLIVTLGAFWILVAKTDLTARRFFLVGVSFTLSLALYYGLFFGANWFLPRYFSVLSPFLWLASAVTLFHLLLPIARNYKPYAVVLALLMLMATAVAANGFRNGRNHMHRQVADWVQQNVPDRDWVGAPQSGTLGYFHDRTINLDGKVNPDALRAALTDGHVLNYVVNSKINYIVDWVAMAEWVTYSNQSEAFTREFEVVVKDEQRNLSALRRIHPQTE